ncbi:B3 DNA binding domain containing protein [Parasponia andersonii]|uniref:B3 DNA binding domain containing protein n=1 Tax=Parasponia andersonii TaxID=3476 RepID=A0A2P5D588_PARAD|nr:B3 DNA binding domain containing protein [Parasponia andersonii]
MLQSELEIDSSSFVNPMLQSHGLPVQFCKSHIPHEDETINSIDENGDDFPTKYLADKTGLSGGGFSIDHQLVDGGALVFHLVKPTEFKEYKNARKRPLMRVGEQESPFLGSFSKLQ